MSASPPKNSLLVSQTTKKIQTRRQVKQMVQLDNLLYHPAQWYMQLKKKLKTIFFVQRIGYSAANVNNGSTKIAQATKGVETLNMLRADAYS
ncbi:hypothetical protein PR048_020790 [Dryococelus australis]|uniref:Uncharacterized protein n=1 Tax=Dryococelus australis TaxID=614101 RepID=A0ABQ9GWE5_9NEOP|nr:hypothetical protein PR048_020790 [Dryococelus australis]